MPSKTWGTPQALGDHILVGGNEEIPAGQLSYVFNKTTVTYGEAVPKADWEAFLRGDLSKLKEDIETKIPNCEVKWIKISWDKTQGPTQVYTNVWMYWVWGFYAEALVKNKGGASLTGLEIVAIIMALAFLAVVVACIALGAWIIWQVMSAAAQLGPAGTIGVGLVVLAGIGILLYFVLGGKAEYRGKKRRVRVGPR